MERIESLVNEKIKWAASLERRSERKERGEFVVEGIRLSETAVASDWPIVFGLVTEKALANDRGRRIVEKLSGKNCPVYLTAPTVYKKASATENPQGILLVMKYSACSFSDLGTGRLPFIAVLDRVQDPGNAGTILRTADAAGCTGIVALRGTVDLFSNKTVRATMGSIFHIPIITDATEEEFLAYANANNVACLATTPDSNAHAYFETDLQRPVAIVFGKGL